MSKGVKNYMQPHGMGKTDHSGQRGGKDRNFTNFLTLYIPFKVYLARCGPCQNMQT